MELGGLADSDRCNGGLVGDWNNSVGGLVGSNGGTISACYATGDVSGSAMLAGSWGG